MLVQQVLTGHMGNFAYLIACEETGSAAIVDPAIASSKLEKAIGKSKLDLQLVLVTHSHPDHIADLEHFRAMGAKVVAHESAKLRKDIAVQDADIVPLGGLGIDVIHTPGHTPDGVCYLAEGNLFTGDTLFIGECGRTDLPGGDSRALYRSLFDKLLALPDETVVWPGHDYGPRQQSTIGEERETNYVLEPRSEDEFVKFMREP